jgi:hypothetical protein
MKHSKIFLYSREICLLRLGTLNGGVMHDESKVILLEVFLWSCLVPYINSHLAPIMIYIYLILHDQFSHVFGFAHN